jgi:hypothetical protein
MLGRVALVRFLQEPHGVTSQKMAFFIVTAMNTSNPTRVEPNPLLSNFLLAVGVDYVLGTLSRPIHVWLSLYLQDRNRLVIKHISSKNIYGDNEHIFKLLLVPATATATATACNMYAF